MSLILDGGCRAFPPRRPEQPIFYPVLTLEYATEIARDWNTTSEISGYAGFVTRFQVEMDYVKQFAVHVVGARRHAELWVPADRLDEFNLHIHGPIQVCAEFYGEAYADTVHTRLDACRVRPPE